MIKVFETHPDFNPVRQICKTLQSRGYQAYLVGGCVRDGLLHRAPKDFDVATDATPDEIERLFAKTISVGKAFGSIKVVDGESIIDVTTYREDLDYKNGRSPTGVVFSDAKSDAQRRDFTINALYCDVGENAIGEKILDFTGGQEDLKHKIIRAIGVPEDRFIEDHLRMLRAVRFAAELDFEIESQTWQAIVQNAALIRKISAERIQAEICKLLVSENRQKGLRLLLQSGLLQNIFNFELTWSENAEKITQKICLLAQKYNALFFKEKIWSFFFIWLWLLDQKNTDELKSKLRLSSEVKLASQKALWIFNNPLSVLGELIEKYYDPDYELGFEFYLDQAPVPLPPKLLQMAFARKKFLGEIKPVPLLTAKDLDLKGAHLGAALKSIYWAQLEGQFNHKTNALEFANKLKIKLDK